MGLDPVTMAAIAKAAAVAAAKGAATSAVGSVVTGNKITPESLAIGAGTGAAIGGVGAGFGGPEAAVSPADQLSEQTAIERTAQEAGGKAIAGVESEAVAT